MKAMRLLRAHELPSETLDYNDIRGIVLDNIENCRTVLSFCSANSSLHASTRKVFPPKKMFWQLKILMVGLPRIGSSHTQKFWNFCEGTKLHHRPIWKAYTSCVLHVHVMPLFAFHAYIMLKFFSFRF